MATNAELEYAIFNLENKTNNTNAEVDSINIDIVNISNELVSINNDITDLSNTTNSSLNDLSTGISNESSARVESDTVLLESLTLLNSRINNLLYDPIPQLDTKNGSRKYLNEFVEVLSTDQIDGLEQRLAFFTNALQGKISGISASSGTGLTIDTTNPAYPNISQNRPTWSNIQSKPTEFIPIAHSHNQTEITGLSGTLSNKEDKSQKGIANGYPSLDATSKIPISQLPILDSAIIIVNNITERNLIVPTGNLTVFVRDATIDLTVGTGWATYLYDFNNTTWIKKSEGESLDIVIVQSWDNVTSKPTEFPPSAHSHAIADVTGLQTALNAKRNLADAIPAAEITETASKGFISEADKVRWENTINDKGTLTTSSENFDFGYYNSFKAILGNNITIDILGARAGQVYTIKFVQDATGNRTVTLPGNCIVATGESIDLAINKRSILILDYDGTEFLCSWKKGW